MKRLLCFLVVLLSTHYLLGQTSIRAEGTCTNQGTGYRLQTTNQVIGCRLQVVGANQATDQTVGRRRTELPLEDQIGERVEPTTNYEQQVTNSNDENDANHLNPVLMGFPVGVTTTAVRWLFKNFSSKSNHTMTRSFVGLGGPIEVTRGRGTFLVQSSISATKNDVMREWREKVAMNGKCMIGGRRAFTSSSSTKDIEPLEPVLNGEEERQDFQEISRLTLKAHEARLKSQTTAGGVSSCWKEAADSYQKSAEYWEKASKALTTQSTLVEEYSLAAKQSEMAADQSKKAVEVYEKDRWRNGWREASKVTQLSIDYRIKSMEARNIEKEEKAEEYEEVAEIFQQASEKFIQMMQLLLEDKGEANFILWSQGCALQSEGMAKKYRLQALEAQETRKIILEVGYREAALTSEQAAEQYKLAVEVYAAGKKNEGDSRSEAGLSLRSKADYQAKEYEAKEDNRLSLAADYRKVIATYQRAADQFKQAGEDYIADKEEEDTNSWLLRGMCLQKKAEYQAKAIEARDAGKETLDRGYRQAVGLSERAADQLELKARRQLGIRWGLQGLFLQARASCFVRELEEQEATGMMTESGPLLAPPPISVTKNKAMRELEKKL